jgi:hypothetical protein
MVVPSLAPYPLVQPAQVWAQLRPEQQAQIIHFLAQLAARSPVATGETSCRRPSPVSRCGPTTLVAVP